MTAATRPLKSGLVQILPLDSISPSPENERLYRPVDPNDPAVMALGESIGQHGIREPLVITLDGWILSGHRRHVAARLAGLTQAPCRTEPIRRKDDVEAFTVLLREYNRQRVKSLDEQLREAIIEADPIDAYQSLIEHRRQRSVDALAAETLVIPEGKARAKISKAKLPFLDAVRRILRGPARLLADFRAHHSLPAVELPAADSRQQARFRAIPTRWRATRLLTTY